MSAPSQSSSHQNIIRDAEDEGKKRPSKATAKTEVQLDISKLHSLASDQQELYLFNFVTSFEKHVAGLSSSVLKGQQTTLEKELVKVINLQSPPPSRVIRNCLGRCYKRLYSNDDRKSAFESVTELSESLNTMKVDKALKNRHAAIVCLGAIYEAAGDGLISLSAAVCASLMKLFKSTAGHLSLRAAIFKTMTKIVSVVKGSVDEIIARDIWKQARATGSSDRGALAQIHAFRCIEQLVSHTPYFSTTTDFEALKSTVWKAGDSAVSAVRQASASCLVALMVKNYSESGSVDPLPASPRPKKAKKLTPGQTLSTTDGEDSDSARVASPTWKKSSLKLELTLSDILRQLSFQYLRSATSNRGRAAIIACYATLFHRLEVRIVESRFGATAEHLLVELLGHPLVSHHRYRVLLTRRFVQKLLADIIGGQVLGESARIACAKILIKDILKGYPAALKEKAEPAKITLTGALNALAAYIQSLGSAFGPVADLCRDALIQVLQHPSYTVQIHASHCLRAFCLACPSQLIHCASMCMNKMTRELGLIGAEKLSARKSVGYANGLAAVLSTASLRPLYSSLELSSRVFSQATSLLKLTVNEDLKVSGTQVQVAWVLVGGLMSLGPNFVKIHLPQLLLLWRNALPKALAKENTSRRDNAELSYLVHVRECTLGSILSFLEHNSRLLTVDISKRIAGLLQNTIDFLEDLPATRNEEEAPLRFTLSLQLHDLIQMARRRVFQCFTLLACRSPHSSTDIFSRANLLSFAANAFAEPDSYAQASLKATIANSATNFDGLWTIADNYGYGVSGNMRGLEIKDLPGEKKAGNSHWHRQKEPPGTTDSLILSPICGAREHDSVYMHSVDRTGTEELPDPPTTEVVNSAIAMFAIALPLQEPKVQESTLEQLSLYLSAKSLLRDPGRKAAITVNISLALLGALKVAQGETPANPGNLKSGAVAQCLDDLLRTLIIDPDRYVRNAAYEALGRLCNSCGNTFTNTVVNSLIETIVSNREPNARAGCAMALASIHSSVGGMAAGFHLKKIHGILMSLCSDPHPTVHFWAVEALSTVAESAGPTFATHVPSTLGLLAQLWISDTHCDEADAIGTSNAELEMPTPAAIAHAIASLINVMGPDLQDMSKTQGLILTLVNQFDLDGESMVQGQSLECWEHIYMYAARLVDLQTYVQRLQSGLRSSERGVHDIAVDGLYNLVQRDATTIFKIASGSLEDQIWSSLTHPEEQPGMKGIIDAWISQTALNQTLQWISRCQDVLTKTFLKSEALMPADNKPDQSVAPPQDEEVAGFNLSDGKENEATDGAVGQEMLGWQVRAYALSCLRSVFAAVAKDHQIRGESPASQALQQKVADIIRTAFLASTSSVVELRIDGLKLIDQVLTLFGKTPDPDFAEALLLEQYQAQISSALTPAFGADSTPELAAAAINVCGTFTATGLVTDVEKMGRILKLLVSSLKSFTVNSGDPSVGDLEGLSSNAQRMIKMAVLSAWADLQVASAEQKYLAKVVKPHVTQLTPLWLSSLQDFAKLRFEPDISSNMGVSPDDPLDTIYAAFNRQTLLKFYQDSWLILVDAIASLIDQDSAVVFDALDRKEDLSSPNGTLQRASDINYRDEPVAFFFVLYGIAFEALVTRPHSSTRDPSEQTLEILQALKKILRPSVAGHAIYQDVVFSETMEVFDRLAQTEGLNTQRAIVEITRNLCLSHPSAEDNAGDQNLSDDIEQLFELTRIIVLVLCGVLPNIGEKATTLRHSISDEAVNLIILSLNALVDVADVFPTIIRADLHACILHIFVTILATGTCQTLVVPKALPIFKRFIQSLADEASDNPALSEQLRLCLHRIRTILANAQRRETDASLQCARNTIMAAAILLSTGAGAIAPEEPLVFKLLEDLCESLPDLGLGKVAAGCLRSLLLLDSKLATAQQITRLLLPRLLHFIIDDTQADPDNARPGVVQSIIAYLAVLQRNDEAFGLTLSLALPALLHRTKIVGRSSFADMATRLLAVAGMNQAAFKGAAAILLAEQRGLLQDVLREGEISPKQAGGLGSRKEEPSIALKLNFG